MKGSGGHGGAFADWVWFRGWDEWSKYVGGVCDNLIEELDVCSGHYFVASWLIWRQIVLFRQSGDHRSKLIPLTGVTKTPPRGTGICEPWDDVGLGNCPYGCPQASIPSGSRVDQGCKLNQPSVWDEGPGHHILWYSFTLASCKIFVRKIGTKCICAPYSVLNYYYSELLHHKFPLVVTKISYY